MATRTVRLDDEAERALKQVKRATGLSTSGALKKGLLALRDEAAGQGSKDPYHVYQELELGPGGYAIAPSTQTRRGMYESLKRKLRR